jgi:hypothetical protein
MSKLPARADWVADQLAAPGFQTLAKDKLSNLHKR